MADPQPGIAIPSFGYKSSISICWAFGFIRKGKVTDGARYDGRMLRDIVSEDNTASDVWADTAYRSQSNERWLKAHGRVSRIHRKKTKGRPMLANIRRGNATKSKVRAPVEHVFTDQKAEMGLFVRTIGIARAEAKITLANLAFNMHLIVFHQTRVATPFPKSIVPSYTRPTPSSASTVKSSARPRSSASSLMRRPLPG